MSEFFFYVFYGVYIVILCFDSPIESNIRYLKQP